MLSSCKVRGEITVTGIKIWLINVFYINIRNISKFWGNGILFNLVKKMRVQYVFQTVCYYSEYQDKENIYYITT